MSLRLTWINIIRWMKFWRVGRKVVLVMVMLLIGVAIYAAIAYWPQGELERTATGTEQVKQVDSFDRVMAYGSLAESIQFIRTFEDDSNELLTLRIDKLKKKQFLAQRIIDLSNDESSRHIGQLNSIQAMLALERLLNLHGLSTSTTRKQLRKQAEALVDSDDAEVARTAGLALIFSDALELGSQDDPPTASAIGALRQSMNRFAEQFPDDSYAVLQLANIAGELLESGRELGSQEYLIALSDMFAGSRNPRIVAVVTEINRVQRRRQYQMSKYSSRQVQDLRQSVLQANSDQAEKLIARIKSNPKIERQYLDLLNCCVLIMQAGYPEQAGGWLHKSRDVLSAPSVPVSHKRRFDDIGKIIGRIGSKLAIVDSVASQLRAQPTLVLLVPATKVEPFQAQLNNIGSMTRLMIEDEKLDVVAIYLEHESEHESDQQSWSKLKDKLADFPGIRLFKLSTEESQSFLTDYPISWLPTWILLDDQNTLVQVSPPYPILEEMLLEVIENSP